MCEPEGKALDVYERNSRFRCFHTKLGSEAAQRFKVNGFQERPNHMLPRVANAPIEKLGLEDETVNRP